MKRKFSLMIVVLLLLSTITGVVWAAPGIVIDGHSASYSIDPQIKDDRLLVPMFALASQLGYSLERNVDNNDCILMPLYDKNADPTTISKLPLTRISGTIMAPLRVIAEAVGASVMWNPVFEVATISSSDTIQNVADAVNAPSPDLWLYPNEQKYSGLPGDTIQLPLLVNNDGCSASTSIRAVWRDEADHAVLFELEDVTVPGKSSLELNVPVVIPELEHSDKLLVTINPDKNEPGSELNFDNNSIVMTLKPIDNRKKVALTFDDGPDNEYTDQILDILKKNKVKATFFFLGQNTETYPETAKRAADEGHEIGNHSYSHPEFAKMDTDTAYNNEIMKTEKIFQKVMGIDSKVFRPPYGSINSSETRYFKEKGFDTILWDVDTLDWDTRVNTKAHIVNCVLNETRDGYIVLMHSGGGNRTNTVAALPDLIAGLKKQNYRFCTVSEILEAEQQ